MISNCYSFSRVLCACIEHSVRCIYSCGWLLILMLPMRLNLCSRQCIEVSQARICPQHLRFMCAIYYVINSLTMELIISVLTNTGFVYNSYAVYLNLCFTFLCAQHPRSLLFLALQLICVWRSSELLIWRKMNTNHTTARQSVDTHWSINRELFSITMRIIKCGIKIMRIKCTQTQ